MRHPYHRPRPVKACARLITYSAACERNKGPILEQLSIYLAGARSVLEIGGGTGQHAVHFAAHLPHLQWQSTERASYLAALAARIGAEGSANLPAPVALDVDDPAWPAGPFDAVYTANTLHIMGWPQVERCYAGVAAALPVQGLFLCYGPYRRHGRTTDSNEQFDAELRRRDPASGLRELDELSALGGRVGLRLVADIALPANNELLVWRRVAASAPR